MNGITSADLTELLKLRDRRAKRREALREFFVAAVTNILVAFAHAFWIMLAVGIAHAHWIHQLPTIGYWTALLLTYLLTGVLSPVKSKKKDKA